MNATLSDDLSITDESVRTGSAPDPFLLFDAWFAAALESEPNDANAMTLATVDAEGLPDARIVLLKGHDARGFVFYTNLESAKGRALAANPRAALLFHWKTRRQQVRLRGPITPVGADEADAYFASRPHGSQIGAWASDQSRPAADREELKRRVAEREAEFGDVVPRPPHWSGFRLSPLRIEFWQDGQFRLHDRFAYRRDDQSAPWQINRLFP
ncbi:MAG: pyridoxamine 5'-phosphate oxidase [Pseudomonadota bacterium]